MKRLFITLTAACGLIACSPADDSNRVVGELASDRIELTAEFGEPIVEIIVAEGEAVIAGQKLLRQNDARATARLAAAQAQFLQSKARMDELLRGPRSEQITAARATVEGATQDLDFRQSELSRISEIHQRGLASTDRKSTRLNSSHLGISYAVFCLKKKTYTLTSTISVNTRISSKPQ